MILEIALDWRVRKYPPSDLPGKAGCGSEYPPLIGRVDLPPEGFAVFDG